MLNVITLAKQLIELPSVTPAGENCINIIMPILQKLGFSLELFRYDGAINLWARYGKQKPLLCFLGHVDVVPPGPREAWHTDPFTAIIKEGILYGRGASDMKTGIAAMLVATENFIKQNANFAGSIAFLITSAEEAMHELGVPNVVKILEERQEKIDYCITGEPSSDAVTGDTIRNGRRGSLNAKLTVFGKQGHVAFPQLACNPLHPLFAALAELVDIEWDHGNDDFPATSLQFSNVNAGNGTTNTIPGTVTCLFNFRFSPMVTASSLQARTEAILQKHQLNYTIKWELSGQPFFTPPGKLTTAASNAVKNIAHITPQFSTGGGTSDARFIAPTGAEVIELGVSNKTAHHVNEGEAVTNIQILPKIYYEILQQLYCIAK